MRRVLIITRFFPPEQGAAQQRLRSFAYGLQKKGHKVRVLTTFPSYPSYKKIDYAPLEKTADMPEINRIWTPRWGRRLRLLTEIYFACAATIHALFMPKPDVVLVSSPPFFLGKTALMLKIFRGVPYIFDVRDLYPNSLIDAGFLKNSVLKNFLLWAEKKFYDSSERVISISEHAATHIQKKTTTQVSAIYNGLDKQWFDTHKDVPLPENLEHICSVKNKYLIYIGNLGRVYDFSILLEAAKLLQDSSWKFLVVGDGWQKKVLQETIQKEQLTNVILISSQDPRYIPALLKKANVGFVSLKDIPLAQGSIPIKIFEYIAAGLPVLAKVHGEAKEYFKDFIQPIHSASDIVNFLQKELPKQQAFPDMFNRNRGVEELHHIIEQV